MKSILSILLATQFLFADNGFFKEMAEEKEVIEADKEGLENKTQILFFGSIGSELSGKLRTIATQEIGFDGVTSLAYGLRFQHNFSSKLGYMGALGKRSIQGDYSTGTSYDPSTGQTTSDTEQIELWTQQIFQTGLTFTPLYNVRRSKGMFLELAAGPQFNILHWDKNFGDTPTFSGFGYFIQPTFGGQNGAFIYKFALNIDYRASTSDNSNLEIGSQGLDGILAIGVIF